MIKLCNSLDIKIENLMKYICIDANRASSNSISKIFVECKIIMCWFHLIANINKNSKKIPKIHQGGPAGFAITNNPIEHEDYLQYTFNQHNIVVNPDCFCPECTSCSCCFYLHDAICYHLISCCLGDKIEYPGLFPKKFVHITTSKKRKAGPWYEVD
ncbi:unnamed protein product [Brachionus calyciflorus]|uniref:SWIM-type domain-containing protein n=1 Tax=Brachionus calyciflorus TaxID=104777 RepID=A0A814FSD1_9BILA|nr:unnamed protein product [Brachionus calyciflorus]